MNISEKIFKLRKEQGLTQESLAEKLNVTRQAVSHWESGIAYPETDKIVKLAKIFKVEVEYLLNDHVISKKEKTTLAHYNNLKLAVYIINIFFIMGYATSVSLIYAKGNRYFGIMLFIIFIGLSLIGFAVVKTIFLNLSNYDQDGQKVLINNTIKYYMVATIFILAFIPAVIEVKTTIIDILGQSIVVKAPLAFKRFLPLAIIISYVTLYLLINLINHLYRFYKLKVALPKTLWLVVFEILGGVGIWIYYNALFEKFDNQYLLSSKILSASFVIITLLGLIFPIGLRIFKKINNRSFWKMVINYLLLLTLNILVIYILSSKYSIIIIGLGIILYIVIMTLKLLRNSLYPNIDYILWHNRLTIAIILGIISIYAFSLLELSDIMIGYFIIYMSFIGLKYLTNYLEKVKELKISDEN